MSQVEALGDIEYTPSHLTEGWQILCSSISSSSVHALHSAESTLIFWRWSLSRRFLVCSSSSFRCLHMLSSLSLEKSLYRVREISLTSDISSNYCTICACGKTKHFFWIQLAVLLRFQLPGFHFIRHSDDLYIFGGNRIWKVALGSWCFLTKISCHCIG